MDYKLNSSDSKNVYYETLNGYKYKYVFYAEIKYFDKAYCQKKIDWFLSVWHYCFIYCSIYIFLVFYGRRYMENRHKYDLRRVLIAWNITLAMFSIIGTLRVLPEFIYVLQKFGVEHSVCSYDFPLGVFGFWGGNFTLSKFAELLDTTFIILRKQKFHFLHWYHHATVLVYCWYSTATETSSGRWFFVMNFFVHSLMYTYYACRALQFKIPKYVSILITISQIAQMAFGIYVNLVAYFAKINNRPCNVSYNNIIVSFLIYASYLLLFCHFFYLAYLKKQKKQLKIDENNKKGLLHGEKNDDKIIINTIKTASKVHAD